MLSISVISILFLARRATAQTDDDDDDDDGGDDDSESSSVQSVVVSTSVSTDSGSPQSSAYAYPTEYYSSITSAPSQTPLPAYAIAGSSYNTTSFSFPSSTRDRRNRTRSHSRTAPFPPYFSHDWNFPSPTERHHYPTPTEIEPSGPEPLNALSIFGIVLGAVAGIILLITLIGCCTSWRRTPARDRVGALLNRFNLQREMQDREYNEHGRMLLGNRFWAPPPPPYVPPPPVYKDGPKEETQPEPSHAPTGEASV